MRFTFFPPRRTSALIYAGLLLFFVLVGIYSYERASRVEVGTAFVLFLVVFLGTAILVPLLLYRLYVLYRSYYSLEPDGIRLRWGLRMEVIPIDQVDLVARAEDLPVKLRLPGPGLPGFVSGVRRSPRYGNLEYLASLPTGLVLIHTAQRGFVISPRDPAEFVRVFQRVNEQGSLKPLAALSVYPGTWFGRIWHSTGARVLLVGGFLLSLGLVVWGGVVLPTAPGVQLAIPLVGTQLRLVTTSQLLFLPILNLMFYLLNLVLALYFYRQEETRPLAYLLLGGSLLVSLLAFGALYQALP